MYVRIASFTGGDAATFDAEVAVIKQEIDAVRGGAEPKMVPRELVDAMSRTLFVINRETGSSATLAFSESREGIETIDRIMNAMTPQSADMGTRASVEIYEVALDEASAR